MTAPAAPSTRWLFGPASDLMLGCGGMYLLTFVALIVAGPQIQEIAPQGLLPLVLLLTATPHYGATLVRVYDRRNDRRVYALFALWATLLIWLVFVVGVYNVTVGAWFVTVFLTWSPWHYSGQNYGIALMMLRRRGVRIEPQTKRFIYLSFFLSFCIVALATHGGATTSSYTPTPISLTENPYRFIPLGIPPGIVGPLLAIAMLGYLFSLVCSAVLLRRAGSWRDLAPWVSLVALQCVWFSIPVTAQVVFLFDDALPLSSKHHAYTLQWMALAHSIQYLWVTTYYSRASRAESRRGAHYVKSLLFGGAAFAIPILLFSPGALGVYSFDAGLGLVVAAAVNIHHFVLDGAIWKLRDGRIARVLLRWPDKAAPEPDDTRPTAPRRSPIRPLLWAGGCAWIVFTVVGTWETEFGIHRALARLDVERMRTAATRLRWVARDHPGLHHDLGVLAVRAGDLETAARELERSLALAPAASTWLTLARVEQSRERWGDALRAYGAALEIDPDNVAGLSGSARIWLRVGEPELAVRALSRALEIEPEREDLRSRLNRAQTRMSGPDPPEAG